MEYSLIDTLAESLSAIPNIHVTFNVTNQYADFFIRNASYEIDLRIDIKTLHDESEEASARFAKKIAEFNEFDDYFLLVSWQWSTINNGIVDIIIPTIIDALFIPAKTIADERDLRQTKIGGSFDSGGNPLAASGLPDTNFGKWNRIVHKSRRSDPALSPDILKLLDLMEFSSSNSSSVDG